MPVTRCDNGKYRIGDGECIYTTRENAVEAYRAYLAEEGREEKAETYNDYPQAAINNARREIRKLEQIDNKKSRDKNEN